PDLSAWTLSPLSSNKKGARLQPAQLRTWRPWYLPQPATCSVASDQFPQDRWDFSRCRCWANQPPRRGPRATGMSAYYNTRFEKLGNWMVFRARVPHDVAIPIAVGGAINDSADLFHGLLQRIVGQVRVALRRGRIAVAEEFADDVQRHPAAGAD